jgi:hypothetical protein
MQPWFQFYAVTAGAAATLLGLLFVTVSMNAAAILGSGHEGSKRLAEQAFQNYLAVLLVSLLALYPQMSLALFSWVALSVTAVWGFWVLARFYLTLAKPSGEARLPAVRRHLASLIGFTMLIVSAFRMAVKYDDDRNWFASATLVLLISATVVSWELLARIAKAGQESTP